MQLTESVMNRYDIMFIGHVTVDHRGPRGSAHDVPGAAQFLEHLLPALQKRRLPWLQE